MLFCRQHRFFTLFNQGVVAQLGQRQSGLGAFAPRHRRGAAARAGTGFKPGCQRIANPGGQQACGRTRYHFGIHNHDIRIVRQHQIAIKLAAVGVDDGQRAAGRIGRGNGRGDGDRDIHKMRQRFCSIQRFTATDAQHGLAVGFFRQLTQPVNLVLRTFAAKRYNFDV